ncbi:MAG: hypothetical protein NTU97_03055, partial [Candidatus Magasanikbacteria bacterium]|nr:hypothetical protein [Candidatus Magasanikbacteria bacterium]
SNIASSSTLSTSQPDTTAPDISNINYEILSASSVRITWTTNESATSTVIYGLTTSYASTPVSSQIFTISHSLDLSGLSADVTYHFKVKSADASFNEATSNDQTFIIPTGDITPPVIDNINVIHITGEGGTVTWLTNEVATSTVSYGLTTSYELGSVGSNILETSHVIPITGLQPETLYHFKVKSADASHNESSSADQTFTTGDNVPPVISNINVNAQIISATITWTTNENANSQVAYGTTTGLGSLKTSSSQVTSHSVVISPLTSATKYYYVVYSTDTNGNPASSEMREFTTGSDVTPPANVIDLAAVAGDKKINLSWQNPADSDFNGVMIRRSTTNFPATPADGIFVYQGSNITKEDTGLTNGVLYYYSVFSYDTSNNFASGAIISATPYTGETPPPPPPPPPGGGGETVFKLTDFFFTTSKGKISVPAETVMNLLPQFDLGIKFSGGLLPKAVNTITLKLNGDFYLFRFVSADNSWVTDVNVPVVPNSYPIEILFSFQDLETTKVSWTLDVLNWGRVYEKKDENKVPVEGVTVSLITNSTLWPAEAYGQQNPQITNTDGGFGFVVPVGKYIIRLEKTGYRTLETNYFNSNGVVINNSLEFLAVPPKIEDIIDLNASLGTNIVNVTKNLGEKSVYVSKIVQKEVGKFVTDPVVKQTTRDVAAPIIAGAAAVSATAAVGASELLMYLRFLFTQPILILFRRKRKGWGVVYNALTKMPLDLVTVRLVDSTTGRVVQSKVTDKEGRYAFLPLPGKYLIDIKQTNFKFPTDFLFSLKEDKNFLDLYHGEIIEVKERGAILTPNIPLDPLGEEKPVAKILLHLAVRRLQHAFSIISLILAVAFVIISPGILTAILLAVQVVFYILFLRLAYPPKPKSWGIVYNDKNKKPLERTVVRIFDTEYNKLLETQVTDQKGRYAFLVGRNKYYLMYEKPGFEKKQSESIDLQNHSEPTAAIGVDMGLNPESSLKQNSQQDNTIKS